MKDSRLKEKRLAELLRVGKLVIGFIAIPVILQAIFTDIKVHGVDRLWIALRLGIIPIGVTCLLLYRMDIFKKRPSLPIMTVAFYVGAIHLFFVSQSGYAESKYFHSYIQILMGLTILPFVWSTYIFVTMTIIGSYSYLILHHANFNFGVFSQSNVIFLKTYVIIMYATFFLMDRVRNKFYRKEIELEDEIDARQTLIDKKAKELSAAKIELIRQESENSRYKALGELAAQVAHNVRSPVGTIDVIVNSTPELPVAAKVPLLNAISQIRGVANKLLKSKPHELEMKSHDFPVVPVARVLANVIEEKRLLLSRYPDVEIKSNIDDIIAKNYRAMVDPTDFSAVISNLIHNSFEALNDKGIIEVSLGEKDQSLVVTVTDDGCGMPEEILNSVRLGRIGLSYMKPNGSGLGIPHAKKSVESWDGRLEINSEVDAGTTVQIVIPSSQKLEITPFANLSYEVNGRNSLSKLQVVDQSP